MKQERLSSHHQIMSTVVGLPDDLATILPPRWSINIPLVRISTCGQFAIDVLYDVVSQSDGSQMPVYGPPKLPRNGTATALNVLKLLICQSERFTTKDWLTDMLGISKAKKEKDDEWAGLARPDNSVSHLRGLLCPLLNHHSFEVHQRQKLGRQLVSYVKPTVESGSGYRLAGYPLIWLDVDAISAHVKRACQLASRGQDAWAEWQAAYQIGMRGPFLAEGRYSDWATERREEVEGLLWQSVQALWRIALGRQAEEEALRLLREYWLRHPENEDAFQPLVEMLGKREDYQRAEAYYKKLCDVLEEERKEPNRRTQKMMNLLRSRQYSSQRCMENQAHHPFSPGIIDHQSEEATGHSGTQQMASPHQNFQYPLGVLGTERCISPQFPETLPFAENHPQAVSPASIDNLAAITLQFRAMQRRGDAFITQGLTSHLQTIHAALEQTVQDPIRHGLWRVLAQAQIVASLNPIQKSERGRVKTLLEAAVASAQQSGDTLLLGMSLGHLAHFSLCEEQSLLKAEQLLHQAQRSIPVAHPLNGWFALIKASIAAKEGHTQQCEAYLTDAMTNVSRLSQVSDAADLYFTDFSRTSVYMFAVNCWLVLGNAPKAAEYLAEINLEDVADNRRASAYCDASKVYTMMGEFELAQQCALRALDKASSTQQLSVISRCLTVAQTMHQKAPDTPYASVITEYVQRTCYQSQAV